MKRSGSGLAAVKWMAQWTAGGVSTEVALQAGLAAVQWRCRGFTEKLVQWTAGGVSTEVPGLAAGLAAHGLAAGRTALQAAIWLARPLLHCGE